MADYKKLDESNAVEVSTVEEIANLPQYTTFKYKCNCCGEYTYRLATFYIADKFKSKDDFICKRCKTNHTLGINPEDKNVPIHINKPEDLEGVKSRQLVEFNCIVCGKSVLIKQYKPHMRLDRYRRLTCQRCEDEITKQERYGDKYYNNHEQSKITKLDRYGDEYYNNHEKAVKTLMDSVGVDNPMKCEEYKQNFNKSMQESYGCDWAMQSPEIVDTYMRNYEATYGVYSTPFGDPNKKKLISERIPTKIGSEPYIKNLIEKYGDKISVPVLVDGKLQPVTLESGEIINPGTKEHYMFVMDLIKREHPELFGGTHYTYDGEMFDGSWEIAYWLYCKDHGIPIEHEKVTLDYNDPDVQDRVRKYKVDFLVDNSKLVEVKGTQFFKDNDTSKEMVNVFKPELNDRYEAKHQCMVDNNVEIVSKDEIKPMLEHVKNNYDQNYLDMFRMWGQMYLAMFTLPVMQMMFPNFNGFTPTDITKENTVTASDGTEYVKQDGSMGLTPYDINKSGYNH